MVVVDGATLTTAIADSPAVTVPVDDVISLGSGITPAAASANA